MRAAAAVCRLVDMPLVLLPISPVISHTVSLHQCECALTSPLSVSVVLCVPALPLKHTHNVTQVIRSNDTMSKAAALEQRILRMLSDKDPDNRKHIIRLLRTFEYRHHVCMVFEPMVSGGTWRAGGGGGLSLVCLCAEGGGGALFPCVLASMTWNIQASIKQQTTSTAKKFPWAVCVGLGGRGGAVLLQEPSRPSWQLTRVGCSQTTAVG